MKGLNARLNKQLGIWPTTFLLQNVATAHRSPGLKLFHSQHKNNSRLAIYITVTSLTTEYLYIQSALACSNGNTVITDIITDADTSMPQWMV